MNTSCAECLAIVAVTVAGSAQMKSSRGCFKLQVITESIA